VFGPPRSWEDGNTSGNTGWRRSERANSGSATKRNLTDGQAADSLAGGGENGVDYGGRGGRDSGFADPAGPFVVLDDVNFDDGRSFVHSENFVVAEIGLVNAAVRNGDFAFESSARGRS